MDLPKFQALIAKVRNEIGKDVQGHDALIDLMLISVSAREHCRVDARTAS